MSLLPREKSNIRYLIKTNINFRYLMSRPITKNKIKDLFEKRNFYPNLLRIIIKEKSLKKNSMWNQIEVWMLIMCRKDINTCSMF